MYASRSLYVIWMATVIQCAAQPARCETNPPPIYDSQEVTVPRMTPEETVKQTSLPEGFKLQVAAQSPEVNQPIGMCWDGRGRMWVVENYTYAEREQNFDMRLNDRILILEDTDGDGTLDRRKVFWDLGKKLTSIEIGYGGVWALAPPNLYFIPDADGDDIPMKLHGLFWMGLNTKWFGTIWRMDCVGGRTVGCTDATGFKPSRK